MQPPSTYRGRFAPSPTGSLHFGSLIAAVGSYLDAKHHHGTWLVRMEDLDTPRCVTSAADGILRTLAAFGLHSDEPVLYQSQRTVVYAAALHKLQATGAVYPCCCTRREIADSALYGIDGLIYSGTCRNKFHVSPSPQPSPIKGEGAISGRSLSWRVRTDTYPSPLVGEGQGERGATIQFNDAIQGHITQDLENEIGDFVVKRADGLFAYQLAVVVDDAFQGITHIVRGADLLHSTPRQIYLQQLLGLPTPYYMHLPIAVNAQGEKLSKQTLAQAIGTDHVVATLISVLEFLQQQPPVELRDGSVEEVLSWAVESWRLEQLKNKLRLQATA
ncbi:MAG: tRNA glutamyl-Q(34) synthetase GluQRS [Gallionella sp.]